LRAAVGQIGEAARLLLAQRLERGEIGVAGLQVAEQALRLLAAEQGLATAHP
jgi:hypothetical protein